MSTDTDMELFLQANELFREFEADERGSLTRRLAYDKKVASILQMCANIELLLARIADPEITELTDTVIGPLRRWCKGETDEQSVISALDSASSVHRATSDKVALSFEHERQKIARMLDACGGLPTEAAKYTVMSQTYAMSATAMMLIVCNDAAYAAYCLAAAAKIVATSS